MLSLVPGKKLEKFKPFIPKLEKQLDSCGKWRLAQKIRRQRFRWWETGTTFHVCKWGHSVIKTEMQLHATAQREIFLKEEIQ